MENKWQKPVGEGEVIVDIGSVTIFVNVPKNEEGAIDDEVLLSVENQVVTQFLSSLEQHGVDASVIRILDVKTQRGCITVVITVGVVIKAAVAAGTVITVATKFFKEYKDIREGVLQAAADVKSARLFIRGKESRQTAAVYNDTLAKVEDKKRLERDVDAAIRQLQQKK